MCHNFRLGPTKRCQIWFQTKIKSELHGDWRAACGGTGKTWNCVWYDCREWRNQVDGWSNSRMSSHFVALTTKGFSSDWEQTGNIQMQDALLKVLWMILATLNYPFLNTLTLFNCSISNLGKLKTFENPVTREQLLTSLEKSRGLESWIVNYHFNLLNQD